MGLTQEGLADEVGVEFSTVGRWERGDITPQPWRRRRIATALGISLETLQQLLTAGPPLDTTDTASTRPAADRPASASARRSGADDLDPGAVGRDAHDAAHFARAVAGSRIDRATLDQLERDIHRFAADYVARPLAELFTDIRHLRGDVFRLLRTNRYPNQMRQLYRHASRASGLHAHVCLDLGDYRAAHEHARTAYLCADLADHHGMRAWVRGLQSLIAYWDGRYADAATFARDGSRFPASGSVAARLPSLEERPAHWWMVSELRRW